MKIKQAELHDTIFVPSIGEIRKQLSSTDTGLNKGTGMSLEAGLVYLSLPQKNGNQMITVVVPVTNFKYLLPEKE